MSLSRRNFVRTLGVGGAGMLSTSFIIGRGREAMAFETEAAHAPDDGGIIRISSNENARGPGPKVIAALHNTISPRAGRGYPPDHTNELVDTIAELYGVERDSVIIGTGSGSILEAGVRAFCSAEKPLVTVAPTYGTPASMRADRGRDQDGSRRPLAGAGSRRDGRGGQRRGHGVLLQPEQPDRHRAH